MTLGDIEKYKQRGMMEINEQLRSAARAGSELRLKALLREPGGNALAQDEYGWTALMYVACKGHKDCVHILLPVSDTLAQDAEGRTASTWARNRGHESLAQLIDAYAKAQSERADLGIATNPGTPLGRAVLRV